jgi:hypothetical protein
LKKLADFTIALILLPHFLVPRLLTKVTLYRVAVLPTCHFSLLPNCPFAMLTFYQAAILPIYAKMPMFQADLLHN